MFIQHYDNVSDLSFGLTKRLAYAKPDDLDYINSADTQMHDVLVTADSATYDEFDLKKVWLTKTRWGSLVRQYLDPLALEQWLDMCADRLKGRGRGVSFLRTNEVGSVKNGTTRVHTRRRWGSCLLGVGYRATPAPHITLHSRTTYVGYIGQLDLALACALARQVGEVVGVDPVEMRFTWHLEVAQFHYFKALAWFYQREDTRRMFEKVTSAKVKGKYPTVYGARRELEAIEREDAAGKLYGDIKYFQRARVRRRYHAEVMPKGYGDQFSGGGAEGRSDSSVRPCRPLPSVGLDSLDLSPVWSSSNRRRYDPADRDESLTKSGMLDPEDFEEEDE